MKRILITTILLCVVVFSFAQDGKRSKGYPRFQSEVSRTSRNNLGAAFKKNLEMQSDDELRPSMTENDHLGFSHDKFQQYYKKVKVEGAVYSAHSRNNIVEGYSGEFKGIRSFDVNPSISASQGLQAAIVHAGARIYAWDISVKAGYPDYNTPKGELVIIGGNDDDELPLTLAWKYDIYAADPLYRAEVYIDAKTGVFVRENNLIHNTNTAASGTTLFNGIRNFTADYTGTTYRLRQTVSGGGVETYTLNNKTTYTNTDITSSTPTSWTDATAVQAHWGAEQTWAFYYNKLGRNSFNNAGAIIKSYVHYSTNYVNAFWDGSRMTYGDGSLTQGYLPLVSLDICGHEITHGVTTYSANLTYSYESGALNESFSDIFGECIENYAKGTNDWMMSCDIGVSGCGAFRNMMNPNEFGDPDTYKGTNWYTGTADYGGVHSNCGVQNKWFYVLVAGESGTNDLGYLYNVTGIGIEKASKIAYRNLTVYLTASSNYAAARVGSLLSATDLYGAGSAEYAATAEAWNAVGVYAPAPDTQAPTAPVLSSPSKTQSTINLSWTAATDNVGVTGYDIYVNNALKSSVNGTTRTFVLSGLTASTTYTIYVAAKDAAGNKKSSNILSVTTTGPVTETTVLGSYFETSIENWVASNATNVVRTNNSAYAYEGNYSILVQSKGSSAATPSISLSGYSQAEVKFYFTAVGMEANKSFILSYSSNNGTRYSTIATFTSAATATGTKFVTNKGFYVATVTMNSTAFTATTKFKITNNGQNTTDKIYFDAFTVKGRTGTTGTGNVVTLAAAIKPTVAAQSLSGKSEVEESIKATNGDITLYPNPVRNTLNIQTREKLNVMKIYSSGGILVRSVRDISENYSFDVSGLDRGVYIIELITEKGTFRKKIIKQ
jgi:Zn-dependent metalloprotease